VITGIPNWLAPLKSGPLVILEKQLQRELDLPRTSGAGGGNHSCCRQWRFARRIAREDLAEDIVHGKVRVIENVEKLPSKLQGSAVAQLLNRDIFSKREVQIEVAGSGQIISSRSSQEPGVL